MLTTYLFRYTVLQNAPFRSQIFKIVFALVLRRQGGIDPLTKILRSLRSCTRTTSVTVRYRHLANITETQILSSVSLWLSSLLWISQQKLVATATFLERSYNNFQIYHLHSQI